MSDDHDDDFGSKLIAAMQEAVSYARGDESVQSTSRATSVPVIPSIDVRALRDERGMSRPEFAAKFGFNLRTLEGWEQGRRNPDRASLLLLHVIQRYPESVETTITTLLEEHSARSRGIQRDSG